MTRRNLPVNNVPDGVSRVVDTERTINGGPSRKRALRRGNHQASGCPRKIHRHSMSIRVRGALRPQARSPFFRRLCHSHPETRKPARQMIMIVLVGLSMMPKKGMLDRRLAGPYRSKCQQTCFIMDPRPLHSHSHQLCHLLIACRPRWSARRCRAEPQAWECPI